MDKTKPSWLRLREDCEQPNIDGYAVPEEALRAFRLAMGEYILSDIHGFWYEPESKEGHADIDRFAYMIGSRASALCQLYNGSLIGSPIESQLLAAMLWMNIDWAGFPAVDDIGALDRREPTPSNAVTCFITPQAEIAGFRVDAALWFQCGTSRGGVAIECDGHAFHEKTKEQASRDKARDRSILAAGFPVMRFTGSEIFRDPVACASQVHEVACSVLLRVSKEGGLI